MLGRSSLVGKNRQFVGLINKTQIGTRFFFLKKNNLLGPAASTGTGTIALDPTFGSFTLLKSVSHYMN